MAINIYIRDTQTDSFVGEGVRLLSGDLGRALRDLGRTPDSEGLNDFTIVQLTHLADWMAREMERFSAEGKSDMVSYWNSKLGQVTGMLIAWLEIREERGMEDGIISYSC